MNIGARKISKQESYLEEAIHYRSAGDLTAAERACRRILREQPSHFKANLTLGGILQDQGQNVEAEKHFRRAINVAPGLIDGYLSLGSNLHEQKKYEEAEATYRKALTIDPESIDALRGTGGAIFEQGRFADSVPYFRKQVELEFGGSRSGTGQREPEPLHKRRHDEEQREYLAGLRPGIAGNGAHFYLEDGCRVSGSSVNLANRADVIERWKESSPKLVVIDNLLTEEALASLRRFCWASTIWHRAFANGYVGSVPELGFACPLIAQIAEDLRAAFPDVIENYPLTRCWAFKCDSRYKGTGVHADFAAVNVNFWITPDEANIDPEGGGLLVWDKAAPLDWEFNKMNNPGEAIKAYLAKSGATEIKVPYRANRAIIFDSDLFHETDRVSFKEGYTNRRINVTMLYGYREQTIAHR